ncbi:MAG TPA: Stp1/IreP family PP2C-type Ser/Thr phosphatase [Phototrophicaceae bacterium]|jgi:protein phosphatase|nr:Stp1/IreP family PP2C-type Ser/Thr phosphatase [Phototrophicaceae bacterium]
MYSPGHGIRLRSNARTNTGKVRENNEDKVLLWARDHFVLAIVADGMGGAAAGEEASRIAVETIHNRLVEFNVHAEENFNMMSADILSEKLRDVIRDANDKIVQHAVQYPELKGMGTTVTLALVRNAYAIIGHVGDSRAYLIDGYDSSISQITSDHSFVEAMVAAGHITRAEAEDHPMRNVLYRALGQSEDIDVDIYHSYLRPGDRLVLCSDGLTLHVKPHEIARIALSDRRPETTSDRMIELANERGGRDNVSVVVINVEEEDHPMNHQKNELTEDDDDTILLRGRERRPLGSSESGESPTLETQDSLNSSLQYKNMVNSSSLTALREKNISPDFAGVRYQGQRRDRDTLGEGHDTAYSDE